MLLPHEVVPFLQHDDVDVRDHAARYLAEAHDPAPATADDLWRAIDRFGAGQSVRLLARLGDLPQTSASLHRLLETLRAGPDEETDYHLQRAVQWLDFPLLVSHRDEVLAADSILPHVREHLRQRLELAEVPADDLWDRLLGASEDADGKHLGQFDSLAADRLIEALARQDKIAAARAMGRLLEPNEDWMEIFCVQLLGKMRHKAATELLIGRLLVEDADVLNEEAVRALARIGTVEVVERLESLYPTQPWGVRLYVDDPLGRIKRPQSERALLRLLEEEREADLRTNLAAGLCDLCTTEALEQVRRLIIEDRYDPQMADLPEELLTVGKMVGYEPPEAAEWRAEIDRRRKEIERRGGTASLEEMVREIRDRFRRGELAWSDPDAADDEDDWTRDPSDSDAWDALDVVDPPPGANGPIRRDAPKVGRNDPCPCGSGKKYKKCCLNAAQS